MSETQRSPFSCAVAACGLTLDDAAGLFGQSRSSILKKSRGVRSMTPADARILSVVWHRIRQGDVLGLPEGAIRMSSTMRILRGVETVPPAKTGPPKKVKEAAHA